MSWETFFMSLAVMLSAPVGLVIGLYITTIYLKKRKEKTDVG